MRPSQASVWLRQLRSHRILPKNIKPSTSGTKSKKAKTRCETKTRTAGKKDGEPSSRSCRMVQVITKVKKTRPQSPKRKASEKTTTSTKKTKKSQ